MNDGKIPQSQSDSATERLLRLSADRSAPPTSWVYELESQSPAAKIKAQVFGKMFGYVPVPRPEVGRRLGMAMWEGDALADKAILELREAGANPHAVIETLITKGLEGIDAPSEELVALWKQVSTLPDWLDWEKLEKGARTYRRYGVQGFQFQGVGTLDSYRNENLAKTLMSTGQYSDDTAFKRFLLTCNFWLEISEPGGMRLFEKGWQVAVRVRLLHTLIRRAVISNPKWDADKIGMPINQVGLHAAPVISSVVLGHQLKRMGYRPTNDEIEAMMHLWRYICYVMGASTEFFPVTSDEGIQMMFDISNLQRATDDPDGIRLCQSFIKAFEPRKNVKGVARMMAWLKYWDNIVQAVLFVSPETRRLMGMSNPTWFAALTIFAISPRNFVQDWLRHRFPSYAVRLDNRMRRQRRAWLKEHLEESDLVYRPQSKY
ncbi:oxygenase MpaB family protein [Burkholderia ambifaria]|nr:oxygenase MpaB family protein [Burkholderia ambifaria]